MLVEPRIKLGRAAMGVDLGFREDVAESEAQDQYARRAPTMAGGRSANENRTKGIRHVADDHVLRLPTACDVPRLAPWRATAGTEATELPTRKPRRPEEGA